MILAGQATTASSLRLHSLAKLESHDEMVHKIWDNVCMYIMIRVNVTVNSNGKLNVFVIMIPRQPGRVRVRHRYVTSSSSWRELT